MPDRSLDSLSKDFYPLAVEWIARCAARKVPVLIAQTSRTEAEHAANLAAGTSATSMSLHLPRKFRVPTLAGVATSVEQMEKCDAMDLVPYDVFQASGEDKLIWDAYHPHFAVIMEEAERVGLRSGGRWSKPFDPGHGELILPVNRDRLSLERARPWPRFRR